MIAAMQIKVFFIGYKIIIYLKAHYCNEYDSQENVKNSQKNVKNNSLHIDVTDLYYFLYVIGGMKMEYEDFEKALKKHKDEIEKLDDKAENIETKEFFHKWLTDAIKDGNKDVFKECVRQIGVFWNVIRNIPKDQFDGFAEYLWSKRKDICEHKYFFRNSEFEVKTNAYSFESKVCFAINPEGYGLIYDSYNLSALKKLKGDYKDVDLENFDEKANKYIGEKIKPKKTEDYFEADYDLWSSKKNKSE